jgi:hypothetical protein
MSRISPTRIASGSWRSAAFSASEKSGASEHLALVDDALLVAVHELDRILDLRMCVSRSRLISSILAASLVLPEPVGPVTRTKPRALQVKVVSTCSSPSSSTLLISRGMWRKAA